MDPSLEEHLRATLNLIPAFTWYAAPSGGLAFVNERCADYLGLPKDHPLRFGTDTGAAWDSHIPLLHPDDQEETRRVWSACLSTSRPGEVSFRVRSAEGNYRWFLSRAEPLRGSDGTVLYWIGINLDIEERRRAEFYLTEGQRLAHMGSWTLSADGFGHWSPELFAIHGLDPHNNHRAFRNTSSSSIPTIARSSRSKSRRCWQSIEASTLQNGLCVPMD